MRIANREEQLIVNNSAQSQNKYYPYKRESDHRLANEFCVEYVRGKNAVKKCNPDCELVQQILFSFENMKKIIDKHLEDK